jgi:hypothetical protein
MLYGKDYPSNDELSVAGLRQINIGVLEGALNNAWLEARILGMIYLSLF